MNSKPPHKQFVIYILHLFEYSNAKSMLWFDTAFSPTCAMFNLSYRMKRRISKLAKYLQVQNSSSKFLSYDDFIAYFLFYQLDF